MKMSNSAGSELSPCLSKDLLVESGKSKLRKWLNMNFRIEMTDGRILIGVFLCTDRDANVILGSWVPYLSFVTKLMQRVTKKVPVKQHVGPWLLLGACSEYGKNSEGETEETRVLGLVMVPGRHIVTLKLDDTQTKYYYEE